MAKIKLRNADLMEVAVGATKAVKRVIESRLTGEPSLRFQKGYLEEEDGKAKPLLRLDTLAEDTCRAYFSEHLKDDVRVVGEESLVAALKTDSPILALVDMIDGTDLMEMGVALWCSALVLYGIEDRTILGAIVAFSNGEIYLASRDEAATYVFRRPYDPAHAFDSEKLKGPSDARELRHARVCFYGQKADRLVSISNRRAFLDKIASYTTKSGATFRIYNFAGNPMMVKMVDRLKDDSGLLLDRGIDAVFEAEGQLPHDFVPGAYIALRSGAHMFRMDGSPVGLEELGRFLSEPKTKVSYVIASTPDLGRELVDVLRQPGAASA